MYGPEPKGRWTDKVGASPYGHLEPGRRYRVIKAFTDDDRHVHPVGESWVYLAYAFLPYHSGLSLFVSLDGEQEWHLPMWCAAEGQGPIVDAFPEYVAAED